MTPEKMPVFAAVDDAVLKISFFKCVVLPSYSSLEIYLVMGSKVRLYGRDGMSYLGHDSLNVE